MLSIFLLRHGETVWNTEQRLQGHRDSPLTQRGQEQAEKNGRKLRKLVSTAQVRIISSPLGRALDTAKIIATKLGVGASEIELDDRLKELCYGRWEGMTKSDIQASDAALYEARRVDRWNVKAPGGESYQDVAARLSSWLNETSDGVVVVVSHGCAGRILRGLHANLGVEQIVDLDERHDSIFLLQSGGKITDVGRETSDRLH